MLDLILATLPLNLTHSIAFLFSQSHSHHTSADLFLLFYIIHALRTHTLYKGEAQTSYYNNNKTGQRQPICVCVCVCAAAALLLVCIAEKMRKCECVGIGLAMCVLYVFLFSQAI